MRKVETATFVVCCHGVQLIFFFGFRSRKFVTPLFVILRSFEIFILAKCCGSFNKFNTYFLWSLVSSLFFHKLIFNRNSRSVEEDIHLCPLRFFSHSYGFFARPYS